jgi:hypothetical protein
MNFITSMFSAPKKKKKVHISVIVRSVYKYCAKNIIFFYQTQQNTEITYQMLIYIYIYILLSKRELFLFFFFFFLKKIKIKIIMLSNIPFKIRDQLDVML